MIPPAAPPGRGRLHKETQEFRKLQAKIKSINRRLYWKTSWDGVREEEDTEITYLEKNIADLVTQIESLEKENRELEKQSQAEKRKLEDEKRELEDQKRELEDLNSKFKDKVDKVTRGKAKIYDDHCDALEESERLEGLLRGLGYNPDGSKIATLA